jgi:hypothetical protein
VFQKSLDRTQVNLNDMAKDVAPFLFSSSDTKIIKLFPQFIDQIL